MIDQTLTPGRRARRAWNRGPMLAQEVARLLPVIDHLRGNLSAYVDKGDAAKILSTQIALSDCEKRLRAAKEELNVLQGRAS